MGSEYDPLKMIIVTATNVGRRPVTITGFGAKLLFGKDKNTDWILTDTRPRLPFEITEGKYGSVFVDQGNDESDPVAYWYAWDSAGKVYRRNVAPWYKRWLSTWQWKRNFRKSHLA